MSEWRLFDPDVPPEYTTPDWYAEREAAPHLEQEGHRQRLLAAARFVDMCQLHGALSVCDLGAGDGGLLSVVNMPVKFGYDLQQSNVDAAKMRGVDVQLLDFIQRLDDQAWVSADVVVLSEVLEHLIDPHRVLRQLHDNLNTRYLVVSSPYTETGESHYGYHTWAWDVEGYRQLLADCGWRSQHVELAWISQVHLAVRA